MINEVLVYLFWFFAILVIYPYAIYPLLLKVLADYFPYKGVAINGPEDWPAITFVISAFNEAAVIAKKLENTQSLSYPHDKLQIIVVSDASEDSTDEIVSTQALTDDRIKLIRQQPRQGKSSGLNLALAEASGEYVIFSDANAIYDSNALYELVRPFSDPKIGYVVGSALYLETYGNEAKESEGLYWRLELWLKQKESRFYSVVGGDGAIYAIRKSLFTPLRQDDINDFVNPLQIISYGYRGLFNAQAICYEDGADAFAKEFARKRRIVNRSWRAVVHYFSWLSWRNHKRYLFMLVSHKVLRWYGLFLVLLVLLLNFAIAIYHPTILYLATFGLITLSVIMALVGVLLVKHNRVMLRIIYIPYYFYFVHLSALLGIWDEYRGVKHVTWQHIRKTD